MPIASTYSIHRLSLFIALTVLGLVACSSEVVVFDATGSTGSGGGASSTSVSATNSSNTATSGGGGDSLRLCRGSEGCVVVARTCCGVCGRPELDDLIAIGADQQQAYRDRVCQPNEACPECATSPNPNIFASCVGATATEPGECQAFDLRKTDLARCKTSEDCRLRNGLGCCESCDFANETTLVAIAKKAEGELLNLVCDGDIGCPGCEPMYPPNVSAVCKEGRCFVAGLD